MMWWYMVVVCTVLAQGGAQPPKPPQPPPQAPTPPVPPGGGPEEMAGPNDMDMTQPDFDPTDMPPHLAALAVNVDRGKYTNTRFYYQNHQELWVEPRPTGLVFRHNCIKQFIQCMLSQSQPQVVCAYNNNRHETNGFWTSESYCHVYFDNCRRRFRVWRLIGHGKCMFHGEPIKHMIQKDPGYNSNYLNHMGTSATLQRVTFPFEPRPYSWSPAPVTDPRIPPI